MKLRFRITKDKSIRFVSHLEYARTLMRSVLRAKLPVAYSEGFNPHMKLSLASALGVGVVSQAEFVEMVMHTPVEPVVAAAKLKKALPQGIKILAVDAVDDHAPALMSVAGGATYYITIPCADVAAGEEAVREFNTAEKLLYVKKAPKTKSGVKEIDVKFFIPKLTVKTEPGQLHLTFDCRITPNGSMKAVDLLRTLNQYYNLNLPVEKADIERLDIYRVDENNNHLPMLSSR